MSSTSIQLHHPHNTINWETLPANYRRSSLTHDTPDFQSFCEFAGPVAGETAIDMECGPGILSRDMVVAPQGRISLACVDISHAFLQQTRA